jgi:methyltransferase
VGLNSTAFFTLLTAILGIERLAEMIPAKRNFRRLIATGGREFGAPHYPAIVVMHVAFFVSLIVEFNLRDGTLASYWMIPVVIFIFAQALRFWVRHTMGERWTGRVVVVPGERLIARGPYRFIPHPNYVAVAAEFFSLPLIFDLYFTCVIFSVLNAIILLFIRIPTERAALDWSQNLKSK